MLASSKQEKRKYKQQHRGAGAGNNACIKLFGAIFFLGFVYRR
jgi:hypothetical protein